MSLKKMSPHGRGFLQNVYVYKIRYRLYTLPGDNKQHNNCGMAFLFSFAHAIIINWRYCVRLSDRKSGVPRCSFWCPEPKSMQGAQPYTPDTTIYIYYPSKRPFPQKVFLPGRDVLWTNIYGIQQLYYTTTMFLPVW